MTQLITQSELEHLSEPELRSKYCAVLNDLNTKPHDLQDWPLTMVTLQNIQSSIARRRSMRPKF